MSRNDPSWPPWAPLVWTAALLAAGAAYFTFVATAPRTTRPQTASDPARTRCLTWNLACSKAPCQQAAQSTAIDILASELRRLQPVVAGLQNVSGDSFVQMLTQRVGEDWRILAIPRSPAARSDWLALLIPRDAMLRDQRILPLARDNEALLASIVTADDQTLIIASVLIAEDDPNAASLVRRLEELLDRMDGPAIVLGGCAEPAHRHTASCANAALLRLPGSAGRRLPGQPATAGPADFRHAPLVFDWREQ